MDRWVEINFDCIPLRALTRVDIPDDASPVLEQKLQRIQRAIDTHGTLNAYYLHNAKCIFRLTNDPAIGMLHFSFEGTVLTDSTDLKTSRAELVVNIQQETCPWLHQAIVDWFTESVHRAVVVEFDRYIAAGDLQKARQRIENIQKASDDAGGFIGMYL